MTETMRDYSFESSQLLPPRRMPLIIAGVLGVVAMAMLLYFLHESSEEKVLREMREAKADANEFLGNPTDWKAWYTARLKGTNGNDRFRAWCLAAEELNDGLEFDASHIQNWVGQELQGKETYAEPGTRADVLAYLQKTEALARESESLLKFNSITGVPEFEDGQPTWDIILILNGMQVLPSRVYAHAWLGDTAAAWRELLHFYRLTQRMGVAGSVVEQMVLVGVEGWANQAFVVLCEQECPPEAFSDIFPKAVPRDRRIELLETELAYAAQQPDLEMDYFDDEGDTFKQQAKAMLNGGNDDDPVAQLRAGVEYVEQTIEYLKSLRAGTNTPQPNEVSEMVWQLPYGSRARQAQSRLHANLAYNMRLKEQAGVVITEYTPDPDIYKGFAVNKDTDGSYIVTWDIAEKLRKELRSPSKPDEEMYGACEPLRLFALR